MAFHLRERKSYSGYACRRAVLVKHHGEETGSGAGRCGSSRWDTSDPVDSDFHLNVDLDHIYSDEPGTTATGIIHPLRSTRTIFSIFLDHLVSFCFRSISSCCSSRQWHEPFGWCTTGSPTCQLVHGHSVICE
jgi:hypothetical protein